MATETRNSGRIERFGRVAMRWITVGLFALLALGATLDNVGAQPSPGSYQNAFTKACRDHGGTPKRVGSRIVKCTLGDGTTITCDFNTDPPTCTTVKAVVGTYADEIVASTDGQVFEVSEPVASGPKTNVAASRASNATIVFASDDNQP